MNKKKNRVKVQQGVTLNIGNFQSVRTEIGLNTDLMEGENTLEAMDRAYKFVEDYLEKKVEEMKKDIIED